MPYSLLLGPNPAPSLLEVLEAGLATGRPLTCHAVYFTKTGLPWQAELSMAPLLDDSSLQASSYSVHVLRPVEPTPLRSLASSRADASSRAVVGSSSSSSKRERSGEQRAAVPPPQNGHAVVSLMGLQTAVQAGHKGGVLAADYEVPGKHKGHHASGGGPSAGAVAGTVAGLGAAVRLAHRSSTGKRQREPSDAAFDGSAPPAGHGGATAAPFPAPTPNSEYPAKISRPNSDPGDVAAADASGDAVGVVAAPSFDVVASMMEDSASSMSIPIGGRPSPIKPAAPDSVAKPPIPAPPELIEPAAIREAPAATTTAAASAASAAARSSAVSSAARPAAAGSAVVAAAAASGSSSEGDSSSAVRCTPSGSGSDDGELAIAEHGSHDGSVPVGSSPSLSGMSNLENASPDISENENASPSGEGSDDGDNADSHGSADGSDPLSGSGSADGSGDGSAGTANTLATAGLPGDRGSGSGSGSAGSAAGSAGSAGSGSGSGGRTGSGDEHSKPTTAAAPKAQPSQPKPSVTVRSGVTSSAASSNESVSSPREAASSAGARTASSSCASAGSSTAGAAAGTTSRLATAEPTAAPAAATVIPSEPSAASALPGLLPNGGARREAMYAPAAGVPPFPMPLGGYGMREHLLLAQYAAVAEVALKFGAPPAGRVATGPFETAGFSPLASAASAACQLLNGAGLGAGLSAALGNSLGAWPPIPPGSLNATLGALSFGGLGASTLLDPSAAAAAAAAAALAVDHSKGVGRINGPPSAPALADVSMAFNTTLPRQAAVPLNTTLPGTAQSPEISSAGFSPRVAANAAGAVVHGGAAGTRASDRIMPSFGAAAPSIATAAMVPAGAMGAPMDLSSGSRASLMPALRAPLGDSGAVSSACDALIAATYASGAGPSSSFATTGAVSGSLATPGASEALVARSPALVPGHEASVSVAGSVVGGSVAGSVVRVPPFLTKLYTILSEGRPDDCAMWCADGRTFRISDPQRFADNCLPRFFKHNKLGSFQQQLLTYGFSRVPNESCLDISSVWRHASFVAGRPELLENISRSTSKRHGEHIDKRHGAPTHSAMGPPGGGGTSVNGNVGSGASAAGEIVGSGASVAGENGGSGASAAGEDEDGEPTSEPDDLPQLRLRLSSLAQSLQEMRDALSASRKQDMQVIDQVAERLRERFRRDAAAPAVAAAAPPPPR
jgi:hypothetical protein